MKPNLVQMKPGQRPHAATADAPLLVRIAELEHNLEQAHLAIASMRSQLELGGRAFQEMRGRAENIAVHLAALLIDRHAGCAWVSIEKLHEYGTKMAQGNGQFGGFDFQDVGPDAVGPRRHKMEYMTAAQVQELQAAQVQEQAVMGTPKAAIEEPEAEVAVCSHPFHTAKTVPVPLCPKCGFAYPRTV